MKIGIEVEKSRLTAPYQLSSILSFAFTAGMLNRVAAIARTLIYQSYYTVMHSHK